MTKSEMIKDVIRMLMEMEEWEKEKQGVTPAYPADASSEGTLHSSKLPSPRSL